MTKEEAQRIVKGYLAGLLVDGVTFGDALANAGIAGEDAHDLRNAAMSVAYDLYMDACAEREVYVKGDLRRIMAQVTGRAAA